VLAHPQGVEQPGHPTGQRHRLELGGLDAGALGERGEHHGRWIVVEVGRHGQVDQAEVVSEQVFHRQVVEARHSYSPDMPQGMTF